MIHIIENPIPAKSAEEKLEQTRAQKKDYAKRRRLELRESMFNFYTELSSKLK
jgi:hypothetical protein